MDVCLADNVSLQQAEIGVLGLVCNPCPEAKSLVSPSPAPQATPTATESRARNGEHRPSQSPSVTLLLFETDLSE